MKALLKIELGPQTAAERLLRIQDDVLSDFALTAREEIESAGKVSREGLIVSMPEFLENLRATLLIGETSLTKRHCTAIGHSHGKVRAYQKSFTIDEIVEEYQILARVIFKHLRKEAFLIEEVTDTVTDSVIRSLGSAVSSYLECKEFYHKDFRSIERLKLLKALRQSQQELENFFSEADSPMFMTVGRKHRCILANEAFETLMNRKLEGELIAKIFAPASPFLEGLDQTFQTKKSFVDQNLSLFGHDHFHVYLHPYMDRRGDVKGVMGLFQNVNSTNSKKSGWVLKGAS